MTKGTRCPSRRASGFTLIEVIGALVIFSVGVLMVMQVSGALGVQMRYAAARSQLAVLANERLDSLGSVPVSTLTAGTTVDTVQIEDMSYTRTVVVTGLTPVLARVEITLVRVDGVGPSHAVTAYTSASW